MISNLSGDRVITSVTTQRRAIVIGGGIAGILASRVLADHFDEVILLERDKYPNHPESRRGAPHTRHVHILLLRGKRILEYLFPGLSKELIDRGAGMVKMGEELAVLSYYGWRVKHSGELTLLTFTQPLLEWCLRRRLATIAQIRSLEECRVTSLITNQSGHRATGVRYRFWGNRDVEQKLFGDLIVDASGRHSRTPGWLSAIGCSRPEESTIDPFLGYASRLYVMPDNFATAGDAVQRDWKALLIQGKPPNHTRGGVLLPVEGKRWHVTLAGIGKDYPPMDDTGFLEFAGSLRGRILYDAIKDAQPLTPIFGARNTSNRWRHYEKLLCLPERFMVMGDALCVFNPVFAQGITVAAMQAICLDRCLRRHYQGHGNTDELAQHFRKSVTDVIKTPWLMATTDDLRWRETEGGRLNLTRRLMLQYLNGVFALATKYPQVDHALAQVVHLIKPAHSLLYPRIMLRVLARMLNPFTTIM